VLLRKVTSDEWRDWRALRLLALEESPDAFGSTLASWQGAGDTEERWRARLDDVPCNLLAVDERTGAIVGQASGTAVDDDGAAELISMYVHPDARGTGAGRALIEAIAEWAVAEGARELTLSVKRDNTLARNLYLRHGFVDHGEDGDEPDEQRLRRQL
jgi:ribosomal protein S18 acetylase RimI-like enzyme